MRPLRPLAAALLVAGCGYDPDLAACSPLEPGAAATAAPSTTPSNLLVVILDDVGIEMVGAYGVQDEAPPTPTLDRLADEGVLFRSAYGEPWCSPSRAEILTGVAARRLRLGRATDLFDGGATLPRASTTIAELLRDASPATYARAVFGKWHLSSAEADGTLGALEHGFERFRGTLANLDRSQTLHGGKDDYFHWEEVDDGEVARRDGYVTSAVVDDTLDWIGRTGEPWLAWVGLHAPHTPWHVPPDDLHTYGKIAKGDVPTEVRAMLEAADHEIGRLLDGLAPEVRARTTVIVVGDNGSSDNGALGAYAARPSKSTVYEAGVRVPLLIAGPEVAAPGREVEALVQLADLFPTMAELGGVDVAATGLALDGVSLTPYLRDPDAAPARRWVRADAYTPNGPARRADDLATMVRDDTWKLVRHGPHEELYRLGDAVLEGEPVEGAADGVRRDLDTIARRCLP